MLDINNMNYRRSGDVGFSNDRFLQYRVLYWHFAETTPEIFFLKKAAALTEES